MIRSDFAGLVSLASGGRIDDRYSLPAEGSLWPLFVGRSSQILAAHASGQPSETCSLSEVSSGQRLLCESRSELHPEVDLIDTVVFLSGGLGSFSAADIEIKANRNPRLLFTDTMMEDADLYRFLDDIERAFEVEIIRIADGRTPWQVFQDVRLLGNSRMDPCSRVLKRELAKHWIEQHAESSRLVFGIGLQECHRTKAINRNWSPHQISFPLIGHNIFDVKSDALERLERHGIEPPRLYELGFTHNNCGGFCIKGGHGHFEILLRNMPKRFAYHERQEQEIRSLLKKDVAILRDRSGGQTRPMTLTEFRERIQSGGQVDLFDHGGCGCML